MANYSYGNKVGELQSFAVPQGAETIVPQLDFSQWRIVKRFGQTVAAVLASWVYDGNGALSTDWTADSFSIGSSLNFGTPLSAVNFRLMNINAGVGVAPATPTPIPVSYLVVLQIQFSGGTTVLAALAIEVEPPPGINKAPC